MKIHCHFCTIHAAHTYADEIPETIIVYGLHTKVLPYNYDDECVKILQGQ